MYHSTDGRKIGFYVDGRNTNFSQNIDPGDALLYITIAP